jgi:hypothetical protein
MRSLQKHTDLDEGRYHQESRIGINKLKLSPGTCGYVGLDPAEDDQILRARAQLDWSTIAS